MAHHHISFPMSKTALVIGATGLLGRGVAAELLSQSWRVVAVSRGRKIIPENPHIEESVILDRSDPAALNGAFAGRRFDLVVDCAAYTAEHAKGAIDVFAGTTGHYFFISTDFVYAPAADATFPISEDAVKNVSLPYSVGKLEAESLLLERCRLGGFPVTILRPPHILGAGNAPGCDPAAGGRDPTLPVRLLAGEAIPLLADGQFLIQPVWSREIGRMIGALAGLSKASGGIFNAPGSECVTIRRYYDLLADILGVPLSICPVASDEFCRTHPDKAHIARHRIYDLSALAALGISPSLSLKDALSETIGWLRTQAQ